MFLTTVYLQLKIKTMNMKKLILFTLSFALLGTLTGCQAVETIFKAGMWWAFLLVALVIAVILWALSKRKK